MSHVFLRSVKRAGSNFLQSLLRDRSGNALAIVAGAIIPLLGIIGGGIDMGRSYLSETRLQQACDAGVLAARKKLGATVVLDGLVPAAVATQGNKFFDINYRNGAYGTNARSFVMTLESDFSISGVASVDVPTTVMRIFAFTKIPVKVTCEARLNFTNTDVMMVLDTTGSMNETNSGDPKTKLETLKDVVRDFHTMMEGSKGPGIRIRYGFVPYSTNVNVGGLLANSWVVDNWTYQSREVVSATSGVYDYTYTDNWTTISGTYSSVVQSSYAGTWHPPTVVASGEGPITVPGYYSCDTSPPSNTYTSRDEAGQALSLD
jgi:hypothetical protein